MVLVLLVYATDFLCKLSGLLFLVCILTGLCGLVLTVFNYANENEMKPDIYKQCVKVAKRMWIIFCITIALIIVIPSQKIIYTMIGVYYAPKIVESVKDNALFNKSIKLLEQKIDKALQEDN